MLYVMVEISAFPQFKRLRPREAQEVFDLVIHLGVHRGGKFVKEQNGYFLFSFHPGREKILSLISEFLFMTAESLDKKKEDLFGYNLVWEAYEGTDEDLIFGRLKSLLFQAPQSEAVWAGPEVTPQLVGRFPLAEGDLTQVLGPQLSSGRESWDYGDFLDLTGWREALSGPLEKQMADLGGKVLRLKSEHVVEKLAIVIRVLKQTFGTGEGFPVVFPLQDSRDALSQLLAQVDPTFVSEIPRYLTGEEAVLWPQNPQWEFLLTSRGGADYAGDRSSLDAYGALLGYFSAQVARLRAEGLPPVFLFLSPQKFPEAASDLLSRLLTPLVNKEGLRIIILESPQRETEFLSTMTSVAWSFPSLSLTRLEQERSRREWTERLDLPAEAVLKVCQDRGAALAHWFWGAQEGRWQNQPTEDPTWMLLEALGITHQKVYYVFLLGQSLLGEEDLIRFFEYFGEDAAVTRDKVDSLKALGYLIFGTRNLALRPDFKERLDLLLGDEGKLLASQLGKFLREAWQKKGKRLSEVVWEVLLKGQEYDFALEVLSAYVSQKINRGEGDFLPLLQLSRWQDIAHEEARERLILTSAAFKLRFALNQPGKAWDQGSLEVFRKGFSSVTEKLPVLEWTLQLGRWHLLQASVAEGFLLLKKALAGAQERHLPDVEIRAGIDIGQALLMRQKNEEGREYFEMAGRLAEQWGDSFHVIQAGLWDACARFLAGQLTGCAKILDRLEPLARKGGLHHYSAAFQFYRARLSFELGRYEEAENQLQSLSRRAGELALPQVRALARLWAGRCLAYQNRFEEAEKFMTEAPAHLEAVVYRAESALLQRDPERAWDLLVQAPSDLQVQPYTGDRLSFSSGYSLIEDKALPLPEGGVLELLFLALKAQAASLKGFKKEAHEAFQELLSRKALMELSRFSPWIYLWHFRAIERQSDTEAHRLTILGRGLKALQTLSSCIEDPAERQEFVNRPYWNAQFLSEARREKLV